jgi:poly(3-hydroxybutyrate) depolymerase
MRQIESGTGPLREPGGFEVKMGERSYVLHIPHYPEVGETSRDVVDGLIVALHGGGGTAALMLGSTSFTRLPLIPIPTTTEGGASPCRMRFVVMFPNGGAGRLMKDMFLTWNAATPGYCGPGLHDDARFLVDAVASCLALVPSVHPSRVFLTGHSNGAMMCYRMALNYPHLFAAIAPVAGACCNHLDQYFIPTPSSSTSSSSLSSSSPSSSSPSSSSLSSSSPSSSSHSLVASSLFSPSPSPSISSPSSNASRIIEQFHVPTLHIHSVDDPRALYHGGLGPPFPMTKVQIFHPPLEETLGKWAALQGRASRAQPTGRLAPYQSPESPHSTVLKEEASGHQAEFLEFAALDPAARSAPVYLVRLQGPGHHWPGAADRFLTRSLLGSSTQLIDAALLVAHFFVRFVNPSPSSTPSRSFSPEPFTRNSSSQF